MLQISGCHSADAVYGSWAIRRSWLVATWLWKCWVVSLMPPLTLNLIQPIPYAKTQVLKPTYASSRRKKIQVASPLPGMQAIKLSEQAGMGRATC